METNNENRSTDIMTETNDNQKTYTFEEVKNIVENIVKEKDRHIAALSNKDEQVWAMKNIDWCIDIIKNKDKFPNDVVDVVTRDIIKYFCSENNSLEKDE